MGTDRRRGIAVLAAALLGGWWSREGQPRTLALAPCPGPANIAVSRCGTLEVPEDHGDPRSRRISLAVQVLSSGAELGTDPVLVLAGGPGQAATETAPLMAIHLGGLLPGRAVVLVDQRGTGRSNPLRCETDATDSSRVFGPFLTDAELRDCRDRLAARADLSRYTTGQSIHDLEAIRVALGVERFNLVGFSYGTLLAQGYLRSHPARVRSAVLESVVAPGLVNPLPNGPSGQAAFDSLVIACDRDDACGRSYPDLASRFQRVLDRLAAHPVAVGGATMDRDAFAAGVHALLFQSRTAAMVPRVIAHAERGDFSILRSVAGQVRSAVAVSIAAGMQLSVTCAENEAALRKVDPIAATQRTYLGPQMILETLRQCALWSVPAAPPLAENRRARDVPVLMLAGAVDPILGPWHALAAAAEFRRARVVIVPGAGHTEFSRCADTIVTAFVEAGAADGVDASCAAGIRRPPFALP